MSFSGLLINLVSITRPTVAYAKGRSTKSYAAVSGADAVPCRIQWVTKEEVNPRTQGYELVGEWNAFFEYDVGVLKDDLLTEAVTGREFIVQSAPIDVTGLRHHVEAKIELIS